ncbi:hypothetical protein ACJX0J_041885, partial [Zea mays]
AAASISPFPLLSPLNSPNSPQAEQQPPHSVVQSPPTQNPSAPRSFQLALYLHQPRPPFARRRHGEGKVQGKAHRPPQLLHTRGDRCWYFRSPSHLYEDRQLKKRIDLFYGRSVEDGFGEGNVLLAS